VPVGYGPAVKVAIAFDHRGVRLRDSVLEALAGHSVLDLGTGVSQYPRKTPGQR